MIRDPSDGSVKTPEQWETVEQLQAEVAAQDPKAGFSDKDRAAVRAVATSANNWGLKSLNREARKPAPAPTPEELRAHYAKHNLGFQPKEEGQ